jgi:hypothetical protein
MPLKNDLKYYHQKPFTICQMNSNGHLFEYMETTYYITECLPEIIE